MDNKVVQSEDKFRMRDALKDWVFWIGILMVVVAFGIVLHQGWIGIKEGVAWGWAVALYLVGTVVSVLGIFHASAKVNHK